MGWPSRVRMTRSCCASATHRSSVEASIATVFIGSPHLIQGRLLHVVYCSRITDEGIHGFLPSRRARAARLSGNSGIGRYRLVNDRRILEHRGHPGEIE